MEYIPGVKTIAERTSFFAGKHVVVTLIINPVAGGFTIEKRARHNRKCFLATVACLQHRPVVTASCSVTVTHTRHHGHAGGLARAAFEQARLDEREQALHVVIVAGGDGTSHDVQSALVRMIYHEGHRSLSDKVLLLRLPFGTGNDGTDGRTIEDTLSLFTAPAHIEKQRSIRITTADNPAHSHYSFNISSIGIDAFIAFMTNAVKNKLPGDSYKTCVDAACLFYNRLFRVSPCVVRVYRNNQPVLRHTGRFLYVLMGASGYRTYGSNQKILSDHNNVCVASDMPLLKKLIMKGLFKTGGHRLVPETVLASGDRLVIDFNEKILMQLDGEVHQLHPADFPLVMELTEPVIQIIRKD